ncbi:MAG TPA: cation transporter dimerization domain-containing protein, partial [Acidimicrobiales bacterium]|nr:cation transporter dimerization domain-containing protein [Acidimicrobiales bacterium]
RVLASVPGVQGVENVCIRWIGHELRAEAEITSDGDLSSAAAHDIAEEASSPPPPRRPPSGTSDDP